MHSVAAPSRSPAFRLRDPSTFSLALLAATIVPAALMMIANAAFITPPSLFQPGLTALAFLSGGHVFITFWFYLDGGARRLMSCDRWYYLLTPAAVMATTCVIYVSVGAEYRPYAYAAFGLSAQWHHARQNVGIYAFLNRAWDLGPMSRAERIVLSLSFVGGILAGLRWYQLPTNTDAMNALMYRGALVCFAVVLIAALWFGIREYRRHRKLRKTLLFVSLSMFFAPSVVFSSLGAASSFAAAHAIQYYLLMYYVMYRAPDAVRAAVRLPKTRWGWLAAIALSGLWPLLVLYGLSDVYMRLNAAVPNHLAGGVDTIVFGIIIGWVITHYIVDAGIWRMSDPNVRDYHDRAFGFLRAFKPAEAPRIEPRRSGIGRMPALASPAPQRRKA